MNEPRKDLVFVENLTVETVIGIFDWEREIRQAVSLDLEMEFDIRKAAASDSIEDTLDYKAVSKRLIRFIEQSEYQLVETLAEKCADRACRISRLAVTAEIEQAGCGARFQRGRSDYRTQQKRTVANADANCISGPGQ